MMGDTTCMKCGRTSSGGEFNCPCDTPGTKQFVVVGVDPAQLYDCSAVLARLYPDEAQAPMTVIINVPSPMWDYRIPIPFRHVPGPRKRKSPKKFKGSKAAKRAARRHK